MDDEIGEREKQLIEMVSGFCMRYLDDYYENFCVNIVQDLAMHPDNPLKRGKLNIWAAGVVCAVSQFTPMFDKYDKPYTSMVEVCYYFDAKNPTVYSKARSIMQMLGIEKVKKRFIFMG